VAIVGGLQMAMGFFLGLQKIVMDGSCSMTIGKLKIGPIFMFFHFSYYLFFIQQPFPCW
jgi:hypothetical protein